MILTSKGFAILRNYFGGLKQSQIDALNFIVSEIDKNKNISYPQAAYIIATAWHETAGTLQPIEEYFKGRTRKYGRWFTNTLGQFSFKNGVSSDVYFKNEYPHLFYGRGYVQLTWFDNYEFVSHQLNIDCVNNPDLVMVKEHAVKILITGMVEGWFTGRKLSQFINQSKKDYKGARRIINGTDKAAKIATEAEVIEKALRAL